MVECALYFQKYDRRFFYREYDQIGICRKKVVTVYLEEIIKAPALQVII
jgi:hypothetical protein